MSNTSVQTAVSSIVVKNGNNSISIEPEALVRAVVDYGVGNMPEAFVELLKQYSSGIPHLSLSPSPVIKKTQMYTIDGVEFEMVYVPAGEFMMGNEKFNGDTDTVPVHLVKIERPFYMGRFPVTQRQYKAIMGYNPSYFKGNDQLPVESVTWEQCKEFCLKLSVLLKQEFRLPSEAEWEYACRAGTSMKYWWGDKMDDSRCWHRDNSNDRTHSVDEHVTEHTNPFGLCDMNGNVWEWCEDNYGSYNTPRTQVPYITSTHIHVIRGGSWISHIKVCGSDWRMDGTDDVKNRRGFRVACFVEPK